MQIIYIFMNNKVDVKQTRFMNAGSIFHEDLHVTENQVHDIDLKDTGDPFGWENLM